MNFLINSLTDAANTTTRFMTHKVREHAVAQGWEPEVAAGISISLNGNHLSYDLGDKHKDRAFVHEFGDETSQPKATIRRYLNRLDGVENALPTFFMAHLKGKL